MSRPNAYEGKQPYIFVSYSHKDDDRVWPVIEGLQKRGMRVWYDEGIEWGSHWDEEIFEHLSGCACVVAFVTDHFLRSENCMDEISYAKDEKKGPFIVFLDDLELTGMMKFRFGRIQALSLSQFENLDKMLDTLCKSQTLVGCRDAARSFSSEQTAAEEDVEAWYSKGLVFYNRNEFEEAVKWYRKAAEQGYAPAQYNLACCYKDGRGAAVDMKEAVKWCREAACQGMGEAQFLLGYCYLCGTGVAQDDAEAVKWYREAALQGIAVAQYSLGALYGIGQGVEADACEAVKWFRKAADQGYTAAQCALGYSYHQGQGVAKDLQEAVKWYRKAARQGDAQAQHNLGSCYYNGEGVAKDVDKALEWLRMAARQGFQMSQSALTEEGFTW